MKGYRIVLFFLLLVSCKGVQAEERWVWPVSGVVSDHFGTRQGMHYGIDIAAPTGTPIIAVSDGSVTKSYFSSSYGNVVFIRHDGYEAVYAHMNKRLVKEGQKVKEGQEIGEVGNTGQSYGAHLHFEVHKGAWNFDKTNAINPLLVLDHLPDEMVSAASYIVQKGDTLANIAKRFGLTVEDLKRKNHLRTNIIYPEQRLEMN
ncbi:peptidoglycan DD-metalloendopeptidase family protein [Microbacteriaceae bacterium 4G12]